MNVRPAVVGDHITPNILREESTPDPPLASEPSAAVEILWIDPVARVLQVDNKCPSVTFAFARSTCQSVTNRLALMPRAICSAPATSKQTPSLLSVDSSGADHGTEASEDAYLLGDH